MAGGSMAAHAAAQPGIAAASVHCDLAHESGKSAPADRARHGHDCLSCQSCANPHAAAPATPAQWRLSVRDASPVVYWRDQAPSRPFASAWGQRARAPPALAALRRVLAGLA